MTIEELKPGVLIQRGHTIYLCVAERTMLRLLIKEQPPGESYLFYPTQLKDSKRIA